MRLTLTKKQQLLRIRDEFRAEHDNVPATAREMGDWAVATGRYKLPEHATARRCAEELADAMALDMMTVSSGRRIRTMHAWRAAAQGTLWDHIETISREHMQLSLAFARNRVAGELKQVKIDLDYFNDLHPDDPELQMSFNFTGDLADAGLLGPSASEPSRQPGSPPDSRRRRAWKPELSPQTYRPSDRASPSPASSPSAHRGGES